MGRGGERGGGGEERENMGNERGRVAAAANKGGHAAVGKVSLEITRAPRSEWEG